MTTSWLLIVLLVLWVVGGVTTTVYAIGASPEPTPCKIGTKRQIGM